MRSFAANIPSLKSARKSQKRIFGEGALTRSRNVVPPWREEGVVTLRYLLGENVNRFVVERRETTEEGVENATQRPHVDRFRVSFILDNFGSSVTDGTARSHRLLVPDDLGETEIGNLDSTNSSSSDSG